MSALTPLVPATKTWLWLLRSDCLALQPLIRGAAGGGGPGRAGREHRHQHDQTDNNWHRLELPLPGPALVLAKIIYLKQINPAVLTLTSCSLPALSPADTGQSSPARPGSVAGQQLGLAVFTRQRNFLRPADFFPGWFESSGRPRLGHSTNQPL